MKLACCIAVLVALAPCATLAASSDAAPKETSKQAAKDAAKPKDCQTIKSVTVRQACLDREAAEHRTSVRSNSMNDAVDKLQREDDLLAKKLKSICRGC